MRWLPNEPLAVCERAVALGVFDGVHIGHRAVITAACGVRADENSPSLLTSCVLSLTNVPKNGQRLTDNDETPRATLGVDEWLSLPFDAVCEMAPEQFVHDVLHERLHAKLVCCGYNYRFGKGGVGNADTLVALCEPLGIKVQVVPSVTVDGEPVSTTRIRAALAKGDMPLVMRLLGRPFTVCRPVTRGNRVGRTLGFPTINQVLEHAVALPRSGVYASLVTIDQQQHFAVTNIGTHPTVGNSAQPQAETFIENFDGDLYGEMVTVELIRHLRDEQRFDSVEALKAQIDRDREAAVALLSGKAQPSRAVLFDFDDTLQDRTVAFCNAVRDMMQRHFPTLSEDERETRTQQMWKENNGGYVVYTDYFERFFRLWDWGNDTSPQSLKDEFVSRFPLYSSVFEHSAHVLNTLRERGFAVGVITNGQRVMQHRKLDVSGLRPLCDITVVSGDEGVHKPNPELFRRAAARLCVAPSNCVYVGDHPVNDIAGALAAEMKAVFMDTAWWSKNNPPSEVPIIHAPEGILPLFKKG